MYERLEFAETDEEINTGEPILHRHYSDEGKNQGVTSKILLLSINSRLLIGSNNSQLIGGWFEYRGYIMASIDTNPYNDQYQPK
jgi:hypothetical protein